MLAICPSSSTALGRRRTAATVARACGSPESRAVDQAASYGGPAVVEALRKGRAETQAAKATEQVIEHLPGGHFEEPVKIVQQATAPQDAAINFLRELKQQTPAQIPAIARAKLETIVELAPDKAAAEWRKLGSETKRILFPSPGHAQALDHFFTLNKAIATNPNASGSGHQAMLAAQTAALAGSVLTPPVLLGQLGLQGTAATLSALLHSPKVVAALTQVRAVSRPGVPAPVRAAALASLAAATRRAGLPALVPLPAAADSDPTAPAGSPRGSR